MAAWRLPNAPRFGIGYDAAEPDNVEFDLPDDPRESIDHDGRLRELLPDHLLRARKRLGERARNDEPQTKVIRNQCGAGGLYGSTNSVGSGFGWGAPEVGVAEPEHSADVGSVPAADDSLGSGHRFMFLPEAVVWPTYREDDPLDWDDASPLASPSTEDGAGPSRTASFVAEIRRILACGPTDHRSVLGLLPEEWGDLQAVQSKYRHLMRIFHPDKRRDDEVENAGGKAKCDEVLGRVQRAVAAAKKAVQEDPRLRAGFAGAARSQEVPRQPNGHGSERSDAANHFDQVTRLQEVRRRQARQAMERHHQESANEDVGSLLEALSQVSGTTPNTAATPLSGDGDSGSATSQIMGLLAGLRR